MVSGLAARFCAGDGAAGQAMANNETSALLLAMVTPRRRVKRRPTLPGCVSGSRTIGLAEVVAHVRHREGAVLLRGDLEVVRLAVVHRRRRRLLSLRRRIPLPDRDRGVRLIDLVGDERARPR